MAKQDFAFGKENYLWIIAALVVIILGFVLMSGGGSEDGVSFNPEIFSTRRIVIAPIVTVIGFSLMIVGVLRNSKDKKDGE